MRTGVTLQQDDVELVAAMARGDRTAIGRLYDRHSRGMIATARAILHDDNAAQDLVHDVFLEAWEHAGDYDAARGSVRTWLALRTRSRALDLRVSPRFARTVAVGDAALLERVLGPYKEDSSRPDRLVLRRALEELSEDQRTVLVLGYFEGLSSTEIAEHLGVPVGTVKSRVAAALTRLRKLLPEETS